MSLETAFTLSLYLNNNDISTIDAGDFVDLQVSNSTSYAVYLSDNDISVIDEDAFEGIEGGITLLDLDNNNLTTVPNALRKLTSLFELYLRNNPLKSLATSAILPLSRTIASLGISLDLFNEWPKELHYFRVLSKLYIDGFMEPRLPLNALSGIENTLTVLEITRSGLDRIPSAICHLNNLRHLSYMSNPRTVTPIFEPCSHDITSVSYLSMRNNSLHTFPDVFSSFVALGFLDISENFIRTIDSSLIPSKQPLTHLDLSSNRFHRIPSALTRLTDLRSLYLSKNDITSIEDFDLVNITNLRGLTLADNPLEYISSNAFQSQNMFGSLNFSNTELDDIPRAIMTLNMVRTLDLEGAPLDCTCNMAYMENTTVTIDTILGTCAGTGENITYFRQTFLPYCPRTFS